jgi:proteasome lid subunit RPN8/RPN11
MEAINKVETPSVTLVLPLKAYQKIMAYATACDVEISGFADLEMNKETMELIVKDVFLLEQECNGAATHLSEEDIAKFNVAMIKKGYSQLPQLWWHSHVNMGVFFSGTDEDTLKELQNESMMVALVVNKRFEMKAKMYVHKTITMFDETFEEQLEIDPLPIRIQWASETVPQAIINEVKEKVTENTGWTPWIKKDKKNKKNEKTSETDYLFDEIMGEYWSEKYTETKNGGKLLRLPRSQEAALEKIEGLALKKTYDRKMNEYVYTNLVTGDVYVDFWGCLPKEAN